MRKYLVVVLLVVIQCRFFRNEIGTQTVPVMDQITHFFEGTLPYTMTSGELPFDIPGSWSFYFIYFFAIISKTVSRMFQKSEYQRVVRYQTRKRWFLHQNAILCAEIVKYAGIAYSSLLICGFCEGAFIAGADWEMLVSAVVMPVTVMFAMAYLQYAVSISANSIIGVVVNVAILVSSVYSMHPLLIGNYAMLIRSEKSFPGGTDSFTGMVICSMIVVISFVIGKRAAEKKDLF